MDLKNTKILQLFLVVVVVVVVVVVLIFHYALTN